MPYFECSDIGTLCEFEVTADTEEVLMDKIVKHVKVRHHVKIIPPNVEVKVKEAIKE